MSSRCSREKLRLTISAESSATLLPEMDLDEQIRALLASPLYLQGEASADRSQVYHSVREKLVSSSSQVPKSTGKPVALLFSSKRNSSQEAPSDREDFSSEHQQVLGKNEPLFRLSNPENSTNHFLKNMKTKCLQKRTLKCESKYAQEIVSTIMFLIFTNNLMPIVWKSLVLIKAMKNLEKSRPDFMKN